MAATASVAAGAAFLAACGGDDDGGSTGGSGDSGGNGLVTKPVDSSKDAKRGGIWPNHVAADIQTLDPNNTTSGSALAPQGLSRLFLYRPSLFPELPLGQTDPDFAEVAEIAPDGLTVTVKLKQDLKLDPRPPTNGRVMDTEDVKYSWETFSATNNSRGEMLNAMSPSAPDLSMTPTDSRTVVFKLAYPVADTLWQLAFQRYMWLMPREADGRFDPKLEMRGNGPWRLKKWEPSVGYTFTRNDSGTSIRSSRTSTACRRRLSPSTHSAALS